MNRILSLQQLPASTSSVNQHIRDMGSSSSSSSSSSSNVDVNVGKGSVVKSFLSIICL